MDQKSEKQLVLEAIASGEYEVKYEPVNTIFFCTKYDGSHFYVMEDLDGARSSEDLGSFTFEVQGSEFHEFIYSMGGGDWYGDDLCKDEEVINALEKLNEFIYYEDYDGDRQWEIYSREYGIEDNVPCYWSEDDDCPKDIESLGDDDVEVPLRYCFMDSHGVGSESVDMDGIVTDEELYQLYQLAVKIGKWDETDDFLITRQELCQAMPILHNEITDQIMEEASEENDQQLDFSLLLSKDFFDDNL